MSQKLRFFDVRTTVGLHVRVTGPDISPHTREDLYEEMDLTGIGEAMVLDSMACENSPADGNPRILKVTRDQPRLYPAWVGLPAGTDESPAADKLVGQMKENGVGMLYLLPDAYKFPLADWAVDDLVAPLADSRVPVYVMYNDGDDIAFTQVVDFCRRHPQLPVIIGNVRICAQMRMLYKAMEACDNLHLDLSCYWLHRGIEYLAERFGSHRLLYGSNWPVLNMAITAMTVASADLPFEDRQLIAGDNLRRLLSWAIPERKNVPAPPPPRDELAAWAQTGTRPAGLKVYDNHGHLGGHCRRYHIPDGSTEKMVHELDRHGIEKICVFSMQGVFSDERYGNDIVIDAVKRYPDRFIGFTLVNPHRGHDWMMAELHRCQQAGLRGIKLHASAQGYPEEGPNIDTPCQFAHEHRQFILNHDWGNAAQMDRLVRTYTNACFFTGHTTFDYVDTMSRYPNLYVCSCPVHQPFDVERIVKAMGADRFLFGSDLSDLPIAWGLAAILVARISEGERRMIIGENLRKLMTQYSLPTT